MSASGNYIVESNVDNWPDAVSSTEEFATGAVAIDTNIITVATDIATASIIRFSSTGVLPSPLVTGTAYYAIRVDATHIRIATTAVLAAAGTAIDITDVGSGTHTLDVGEGSSTADRQAVINEMEHLIERITHDFFYAKAFVIYRNGSGSDRLFLSLTADVLSVSEVAVSGVALSTSWYTFDINSVYLDPEAAALDEGEMAELHLRLKYKRILFPSGMGNIKITGTYGWSACPTAIKQAVIILCRARNDSTLYDTYKDFDSERLGDAGYSRDSKKRFLTGIPAADELIRHYIRKKPMLSAV